jgi:hypothetical protein
MNIKYELFVEQDDNPVRGNAMVSGDDAFDKEVEDNILKRLDDGDVWAWAQVGVVAEVEDETGWTWRGPAAWLGGVSVKDEKDFVEGDSDYYEQLKADALDNLKEYLIEVAKRGETASKVLGALS